MLDWAGHLACHWGRGAGPHLGGRPSLPLPDGPDDPGRSGTSGGERLSDAELAESLLDAVEVSLQAVAGRGILAHMFSILPKAGMSEDCLPS